MPAFMSKDRGPVLVAFVFLLVAIGVASVRITTATMFVVSVLMFVTCLFSALHLFGRDRVIWMVPLAVGLGYFAEYMGEHYGWFFGNYNFTDALGPRVAGVPVVIPLMWFSLTYICLVLGNILLFRAPRTAPGTGNLLASSFMCALLVTAYDLGMDPYMVFVTKAWVMQKTDGWWFGETLQGFVGWVAVAFAIALVFNLINRGKRVQPEPNFGKYDALIPILMYANQMGFLMMYGFPVETRTVACFAMGIPLMVALLSINRWSLANSPEDLS